MASTYNSATLSLTSLKDFQDAELAARVLQEINEAGQDFIPNVYGEYEPLKTKYDSAHCEPLIRIWTDEGATGVQRSSASAWLQMEKRGKSKASYMMHWEKNQQARFNFFTFSVDLDYLRDKKRLQKFMDLGNRLLVLLEPVQANIWNYMLPEWCAPIDLKVRHPELAWINYFGGPYIDLFGREKLLSAPCFRTFELEEDIIALQLTEELFQPIPSDVRRAVKKHLGEDAFVEEGKTCRAYKTGLVPEFDFSKVLFDPSKPIEEPQIRRRDKSKTAKQQERETVGDGT